MRVLVVGASSGIGLETTRQALEAGLDVRAFSRSAGDMALSHPKLEKFSGDALSGADTDRALDGIEAVVSALGIPFDARMIFGPVTLFSDSARLLVPAMKRKGVRRLIAVTGFGAGESSCAISCIQRLPFQAVFGRAYDDKSRQERMIRSSGLDWTIARPGVLTNGPKTERYKILTEPDHWRNGVISRADVASFLIRALTQSDYIGQAPVLCR